MNIAAKLFNWLFKLSPHNAANPSPSAMPHDPDTCNIPNPSSPIETFLDQEAIFGSGVNLGFQHSIGRTARGELIRFRKKMAILCGCGHLVSQLHAENESGKPQRGIEGKCCHCEKELAKMLKKGLISAEEADRQAYVCTECAKMVAGVLCCPKHYVPVPDANGGTAYISLDEHDALSRKDMFRKILTPYAILFGQTDQPQLPEPEKNQ